MCTVRRGGAAFRLVPAPLAFGLLAYEIDDAGTLRLTWPFGIESELIEADLRELLEGELSNAEA